jgi:RNA polymerase sigma-70 factor (ECF subfamily)
MYMPVSEDEPVTAIPDALLLRRFREGDEDSYEMLFNRHYDMVYGVLYRLTGTRQEAEDRAQEVFLKLYRYPLRHDQNVAGWLYRVAVNTGYNALRSDQRRRARERVVAQDAEPPPRTEEEVTRREATRQVRAALAAIPPRAAKLLILRESGFSYRELADIVGVAPGSVGTLLARAQKAFRKAYRGVEGVDHASSI